MAKMHFRKSKKVGPFRLTASKSGLSYSVGSKYARVTKRVDGKTQTTTGIPQLGLRKTTVTSSNQRGGPPAQNPIDTSASAVVEEIGYAPRPFTFKALAIIWFVALLVIAGAISGDAGIVIGLIGASALMYGLRRLRKNKIEQYHDTFAREISARREAEWARLEALSRVRPAPRLFKSAAEAEELAQEWMMYFGYIDAETTNAGADAGIDVEATEAVAQVKAQAKQVGRPVVQQTYGAARAKDKDAVIFSLAGYSADAIDWAEEHGVALFEFNHAGMVEPVNSHGEVLMARGDARARRTGGESA